MLVHCAMGQSRSHLVSQCVFAFPSSEIFPSTVCLLPTSCIAQHGTNALTLRRSASIVIAYVMATKQMDADQATECVRFGARSRRQGALTPALSGMFDGGRAISNQILVSKKS